MTYKISGKEIVELKQTMGFRVGMGYWNEFVAEHPDGWTGAQAVSWLLRDVAAPA